jgi:hypothetical protein
MAHKFEWLMDQDRIMARADPIPIPLDAAVIILDFVYSLTFFDQ